MPWTVLLIFTTLCLTAAWWRARAGSGTALHVFIIAVQVPETVDEEPEAAPPQSKNEGRQFF